MTRAAIPLALILAGTGCVRDPTDAPRRCTPAVTVQAPFQPFHPLRTYEGASASLVDLVYQTVTGPDGSSTTACKVESVDRTGVLLRVLDGRFHDGSPVHAQDVADSINLSAANSGLAATVAGDRLVRVSGSTDGSAVLRTLSRVAVTRSVDARGEVSWKPPVGSGPFSIESFSEREVVLRRARSGASSELKSLTIHAVENTRAAGSRALTNSTDFVPDVSRSILGFLGQSNEWRVMEGPSETSYFVALSDGARGLGLGALTRRLLPSISPPAGTRACSRSHQTGLCALWSEPAATAVDAHPPPSRIVLVYWANDEISVEAALRLQQRFDQHDLLVDLVAAGTSEYMDRLGSGDYDLILVFTPIASPVEFGAMLSTSWGSAFSVPGAAIDALTAGGSRGTAEEMRVAWNEQDRLTFWFGAPGHHAIREPYASMGHIADPPIRTVLSWRSPEGCPR